MKPVTASLTGNLGIAVYLKHLCGLKINAHGFPVKLGMTTETLCGD